LERSTFYGCLVSCFPILLKKKRKKKKKKKKEEKNERKRASLGKAILLDGSCFKVV
jgi:hypothetical protein